MFEGLPILKYGNFWSSSYSSEITYFALMGQEVIVFGDSITHGIYGEAGFSWCDLLKKEWQKNSYNLVYNLWIPWDTTIGVLERFERETSCRGHDAVVFAIGINDTRCVQTEETNKTSIVEFSENLGKLVDLASKYTDKIAFIWMTPVRDAMTDKVKQDGLTYFYSNDAIRRYDSAMKETLTKKGISIIEVSDCIEASDLSDGIHPNQNGQNKMFRKIFGELRSQKIIH